MLMKILKKLAEGGRYSNTSMANELGVDEKLVEQIIEQLQHLGYIEKKKLNDCSGDCHCDSSTKVNCCSSHNVNLNIWSLTSKGIKAVS